MTQEQLAEAAGVDPKTVTSFEAGKHWPWSRNIIKLEDGLALPRLTLERVAQGADVPVDLDVTRNPETAEQVPQDAPVCSYERSILAEDGLSEETKAQVIRVHRAGGHSNCTPLTGTQLERKRALA